MELNGKLAVITGASRGIGRALSIELAKSGCGLLLTALEDNEMTTLSNELQAFQVEVATIAVDISTIEGLKSLIRWILQREKPPDILVNNAGIGGDFGKFECIDLSNIEKIITVNIIAFVHLTHELIPVLKKRPRAKIINMSSGIARLPYPGLAVYGATKAFVSSFSESLACELSETSVDVLCFHPGFTITPFIESSRMNLQKIPRRFIRSPEYVAARIVRAIKKDTRWDYSDFTTRWGAILGTFIPSRLRIAIFKDSFWRLPNAK